MPSLSDVLNKAKQKRESNQIRKKEIRLMKDMNILTPLENLVSSDFDHAAFTKAVQNDKRFDAPTAQRLVDYFDPDSAVTLDLMNPDGSIMQHIGIALLANTDKRTELDAAHPVSQMWQDVWQQSLQHYAAEAVEYEAAARKAGHSIADDPSGYPFKAPPILLDKKMPSINAAATVGPEAAVEAIVSRDFLNNLAPEQQKAILFHEAQHALEPMLAKQDPSFFFVSSALKSMATVNATSRNLERRADEHAAKMGAGEDLQSALSHMVSESTQFINDGHALMKHLKDSGFAIDSNKTAAVMNAGYEGIREKWGPSFAMEQGVPLSEKRINPAALDKRVERVNNTLSAAAKPHDFSIVEGTSVASKIRNIIRDKTASHPNTTSRIEELGKVAPCDGCDPKSPSTSHADRLTQVSSSGVQGFSR